MSIQDRIRANLRRYIARSGYTESMVGNMSGAGQANLSRFLSGKVNNIGTDKLEKIATFLNVDIWRFFEPEDKPIPSQAHHALNVVSEQLDIKEVRILLQTAHALADEKKTSSTTPE